MTASCTAAFVINLLQDVNILRPLVVMASHHFGLEVKLLVSSRFLARDQLGIWQAELAALCEEAGATSMIFDEPREAFDWLSGRSGLIFAGSESDLSAHSATHDVFRAAPSAFLRVTLQHGFECVGFRHSGDHERAYGKTVSFGADIVCAWYGGTALSAMAPSQRRKLHVTGCPALLQQPQGEVVRAPDAPGLVCENLHSVRLNIAGDFKSEFVDAFQSFCTALARQGRTVALRPHPGGQYVLKNNVELPANAVIENSPMYRLDLRQFSYGISAPSSVLIDMLLAAIPTGVWRDSNGLMDSSAYDGLTILSSRAEWLDFSREAAANPHVFLERQARFLERLDMSLDPQVVYERFSALFLAALRRSGKVISSAHNKQRLLFIANDYIPTLQLSFIKPLASLREEGLIDLNIMTDRGLRDKGQEIKDLGFSGFLQKEMHRINPDIIIFCRYSGPYYEEVLKWANFNNVPVIYHVDDDLLNIPLELGLEKYRFHNDPERIASVRTCLQQADLVYCSTQKLKKRLMAAVGHDRLAFGSIYCSASVINQPEERPVRTVGYMGFDHAHDLELVLPALVRFLRSNREVNFELFGSIPKPSVLDEFGDRIVTIAPVRDYAEFLRVFAARNWDIGICPLVSSPFNLVKANTKWVEYTASGIAVIASGDTVYDDCCADGAGILVETEDEWFDALVLLANDPKARFAQVKRAQEKLNALYSTEKLKEQVMGMVDLARQLAKGRTIAPMQEAVFP